MVLFALTNITMDVTLGVAWWVVKNTVYGTYCLGSYLFCTTEPPKEDKEMLELKYQIAELNNTSTKIEEPDIICDVKSHVDVEDAFVLVDE